MERTPTIEKEQEDKIDYNSFLESENRSETKQQNTGVVQLTEYITADQETLEMFNEQLDFDGSQPKFFKAQRDLSDETMYIAISSDDWNVVEEWTGKSKVEELAGQYIPIKHVKDDIYTVNKFEKFRKDHELTVKEVKTLYDMNCIKFEDNEWVMTSLWEDYNTFVKNIQTVTSVIGLIFATFSVVAISTNPVFPVVYLLFLFGWMATLAIQMYLAQRRMKPITPIIENIR